MAIYIPREYMHHYKISEQFDHMIREEKSHSILYRRYEKFELLANEKAVPIRGGLTYLPRYWLRQNNLHPGDFVYLIGMPDCLLIHTKNS